ncbi:MAG TPA: GNAT family N-acetyltransferase [Candidatus Altiarchaeales archaeon]|nr:GNAT family N-acetyltransferase [Candidatus Altiarchaeales archaeon]
MEFRGLEKGDIEKIVRLRREYYECMGEKLTVPSLEKFKSDLEKQVMNQRLVIADDDGFAGAIFLEDRDGADVYVKTLQVEPEKRGLGIGTALLKEAEDWAKSIGATSMTLTVKPENTIAKELYENKGFKLYRYLMKKDLEE